MPARGEDSATAENALNVDALTWFTTGLKLVGLVLAFCLGRYVERNANLKR